MVDPKPVERHTATAEAEPRVLRLRVARPPQIHKTRLANGHEIVRAHELVRLCIDERLARVEIADEEVRATGAAIRVPHHSVPEGAKRGTMKRSVHGADCRPSLDVHLEEPVAEDARGSAGASSTERKSRRDQHAVFTLRRRRVLEKR